MSARMELGIGIEDSRAPQVRLGLEQSLGTVRLVAVHTGKPTKLQTLARFEVDEASGHVTCELLPLGSEDIVRAFGTSYGAPMPITIVGETRKTTIHDLIKPERPSGGLGIRISHSDALAMKQLLGEGKVDLVIGAIDDLIESRKAEVHADLAWNFDAWITSYTGKMKPETMRFSVDEMRKAFEAGRDVFHPLPADVVRLVIAAREVAFGDLRDMALNTPPEQVDLRNAMIELDAASEAFASRVRWDDEPSDEEALGTPDLPRPVVHHGTINIDGQDHAIRLEIHECEGDTFDGDGHAVEDDGFETIDLAGLKPSSFNITTPRFDPDLPVRINGIPYVRVGCAKCGGKPVITNLDGDDLCSPCANKWALGEAQAEHDRQEAEAEHREEGDANG